MKKINIGNDNQEMIKKECVSFLRRKRHTIRLIDFYLLSGAKVATFNEQSKKIGLIWLQFNNIRNMPSFEA